MIPPDELKEALEISPPDFTGPCAHGRDPYSRCDVCNGDYIQRLQSRIDELEKILDGYRYLASGILLEKK